MINIKEDNNLNKLNHSCAHLLAQAINRLYPESLLWVGPVIETGFYYDIDIQETIKEADFEKIEKEMKKISKDGKRIIKEQLTKEQALEKFKDNPYKIELINQLEGEITCYNQGEFSDLCKGPHIETVKQIKYFKILKTSGAYYKGDSKNKVLQRIYGICFETEEDLNNHLNYLEEVKQRDHRKIGKDLHLFATDDLIGAGLPMWLPKGATIKRIVERYIQDKELEMGYDHVYTPAIGSVDLYKKSGHWDHYKEDMFPVMELDNEQLVLRPMNCPHHMLVYKTQLHSYKDLPLRIGELAHDYRYESSGAVCGLERVRCMCMNDAHIFITKEQIEDEFKRVVDLILEVYKDFDITYDSFRLSLRDPKDKEKYYQDDKMWDMAENKLRIVLNNLNIKYEEAIGEAAFYGPKLDVQVKSAIGHEFTLSTCQLDFLLPSKFELSYINEQGQKEEPVVIHRAITSTSERFVSYLIERYKGAFPLWLAPNQINIIPVNNAYHLEYANKIYEQLNKNFRTELNTKEEKLGYKLRESIVNKNPITIIIGQKEVDNNQISYRTYNNEETITTTIEQFIEDINEKIKNKS